MPPTVVRALCAALFLGPLMGNVSSYVIVPNTVRCAGSDCKVDLPTLGSLSTAPDGLTNILWVDESFVDDNASKKVARPRQARAVIPVPKTVPIPKVDPDPSDPATSDPETFDPDTADRSPSGSDTDPETFDPDTADRRPSVSNTDPAANPDTADNTPSSSDNPDTAAAPASSRTEDPEVLKAICGTTTKLLRRADACPPQSPDNSTDAGFGEDGDSNDGLVQPQADSPDSSDSQLSSAGEDEFTLLRGVNPRPVDRALQVFQNRTTLNIQDEPVYDSIELDQFYTDTSTDLVNVTESANRVEFNILLQRAGIDFNPQGVYRVITSKTPLAGEESADSFHRSAFSSDGAVVYTDYSHKSLDCTTGPNRMRWYQAIMNGLTTRIPAQNPKALRAVAQVDIANTDTKTTIKAIFQALNPQNTDDMLVLNANDPDPDRAAAFDAFMKSENGRGTYYLLANYQQAFGGKTVIQVLLKAPLPGSETEDGIDRPPQALIILSEATS